MENADLNLIQRQIVESIVQVMPVIFEKSLEPVKEKMDSLLAALQGTLARMPSRQRSCFWRTAWLILWAVMHTGTVGAIRICAPVLL